MDTDKKGHELCLVFETFTTSQHPWHRGGVSRHIISPFLFFWVVCNIACSNPSLLNGAEAPNEAKLSKIHQTQHFIFRPKKKVHLIWNQTKKKKKAFDLGIGIGKLHDLKKKRGTWYSFWRSRSPTYHSACYIAPCQLWCTMHCVDLRVKIIGAHIQPRTANAL